MAFSEGSAGDRQGVKGGQFTNGGYNEQRDRIVCRHATQVRNQPRASASRCREIDRDQSQEHRSARRIGEGRLARSYKPLGNPQEILAKQTEFAKKVFDTAVQGARESAEASLQSTAEAVKIIQERMKANLEELRRSVSRHAGGSDKPKT